MNRIIEIIVGTLVAWVVFVQARFRASEKKVTKLETELKDEKIKTGVRSLPDDELDDLLEQDLGGRDS